MDAICILEFSICFLWSALSFLSHSSAEAHTCFAFYRIMKDRQRYIMVRRPLIFISALQNLSAVNSILSACVLFLFTAACFLHTPTLCLCLSQIYHLFLQLSPLLILIFWSFFFFFYVWDFFFLLYPLSACMHVFWHVRVLVPPSVCMCVIIARPPRGNQQWSSDSPDPLVPQHTCPRGAVLMSFEPLCECICVCAIIPSVPELGGVGVGMLHHLL